MNPHANRRVSKPAGRWRACVRGLRASISASRTRLNAMATERAATMASTIQPIFNHKSCAVNASSRQANKAPVKANGNAKMECSNLIISSVRRRRLRKEPNAVTILTWQKKGDRRHFAPQTPGINGSVPRNAVCPLVLFLHLENAHYFLYDRPASAAAPRVLRRESIHH